MAASDVSNLLSSPASGEVPVTLLSRKAGSVSNLLSSPASGETEALLRVFSVSYSGFPIY